MDLRIAVLPTTYGEQVVLRILQGARPGPARLSRARDGPGDGGASSAVRSSARTARSSPAARRAAARRRRSTRRSHVLNEPSRVIVDDRGPGRVPDARRRRRSRSTRRRAHVRPRPADDPAQRPRRDPRRRDPRRGDGADRDAGGDDGPPRPEHAARANASSSIVRLKDMGVEPGLLATVAQLHRRAAARTPALPRDAARPYEPTDEERQSSASTVRRRVHSCTAPRGATRCLQTGFEGRVALYEAMSVEGKIRAADRRRPPKRSSPPPSSRG